MGHRLVIPQQMHVGGCEVCLRATDKLIFSGCMLAWEVWFWATYKLIFSGCVLVGNAGGRSVYGPPYLLQRLNTPPSCPFPTPHMLISRPIPAPAPNPEPGRLDA